MCYVLIALGYLPRMARTRRTKTSVESDGEASLNGTQIRELVNNEVTQAVGEAILVSN